MKKLLLSTIVLATVVFASESNSVGVKPVDNELYIKECGSCHFDFQPGLLPEKSWKRMMGDLENHFGTDATLAQEDHDTLVSYLNRNSSDKAMQYKRSRKMTQSISTYETPLKITEVPYFIKKHRKLPKRFIMQKEVKTLSNCMACHTTANKGIYSERAIKIPNYGRWDD
ncbi:MAG: diheme cytochrome c [Arcobacteraceae bacterium]